MKAVLERLFANPSLVTKQLVDDLLKYKRMDGVAANLRMIADGFCPSGKQAKIFRAELEGLRVPTLVIWGGEDRIIPAAHAQGLPAGVTTHILPGGGHMVQMEAASKVNRIIEAFVDRNK